MPLRRRGIRRAPSRNTARRRQARGRYAPPRAVGHADSLEGRDRLHHGELWRDGVAACGNQHRSRHRTRRRGALPCERSGTQLRAPVAGDRGRVKSLTLPGMPATRRRAYLAWIAVCLIWGTTYLGIRIALETIPPFLMAAFRWIVAGSLIIAILTARGERMPPARSWGALAVLGALLLGFGNGGVVWAERTVSSGLTAVLVSTAPFWMVGIEALTPDGDPLTLRHVVGLLVGFAGIVILVWPEIHMGGSGRPFLGGVVAAQLACVGWAVGSTYARRHARQENVVATAAFEMLFGGLLLLALGSFRNGWAVLAFNPRTAGALAYLT